MIVPSIDLMNGNAVQLIGGKELAIDAGDPLAIAEQFSLVGDIAVIDLDAALGKGDNNLVLEQLMRTAKCRVGGGIRTVERAYYLLNAGAAKVIIGTRAEPQFLKRLPRDRVIAAVDSVNGDVVTNGWTIRSGATLLDKLAELQPFVSGFLVTLVENEGRMTGVDFERMRAIKDVCGDCSLTVAGGVATAQEVAELDRMGIDAQVGMAVYTSQMSIGAVIAEIMRQYGKSELWPTVVVDEFGVALGLCWSNATSVGEALRTRRGVYHSRSRGLWIKGETSGATQELVRVELDCDRDCLRFVVRQEFPGFCHNGTRTCWGPEKGIQRLVSTIGARLEASDPRSYTKKLLADRHLLGEKLLEEAQELTDAESYDETVWEAADLLYFLLVTLVARGVPLEAVESELDRRSLRVREVIATH